MSFYQEETIYCLQVSEIAYFLQGKALQEINCFRSLQEINLFLPSKTHDIPCLLKWNIIYFYIIYKMKIYNAEQLKFTHRRRKN